MAAQTLASKSTAIVEGTALVAGATRQLTGRLAFSGTGLSFWGGVDPVSGKVIDERHPLCGRRITDSILAIPSGRGSCTASQIVLELVLNNTAPRAIVLRDRDAVVAVGALVAREFFGAIPPLILACTDFDALESLDGEFVSVTADTAALPLPQLTEADQAALDGANGPAVQRAMRIVVETARIQGAASLVDVAAAHIDACTYVGPGGLAFAEKLVELGGSVKVPTTTNSCSVDRRNWRRLGVSEELGEPASRVADAYVALGCTDSFTCAPYLLESAPSQSTHVAWGESNAVVYANSVLGAKTQKYADYLDACAALTGRAPLAGAHIERDASVDIVCDLSAGENDFWPLLGYVVGLQAGSKIPYVRLEASPSRDDLKAFAAAFGTTSGAPLFHAPWTPRIGLIERPRPSMTLSEGDLATAWADLCKGEGDVDLIALGSPHLSLDELEALASYVAGEKKHDAVRVVATLGGATRRKASSDALKALDAFGVELVEDTCWCMLTEPVVPPSSGKLALTDSAKYAHYAPGLVGRRPRLASMSRCVASAISGRFAARRPAWLQSRRGFAAAARRVLLVVR
uniref:Aconitase X catalytic domain-containing protein n=1 Tax=Pelagomonas calceolata TaxID=35677 RepID=A0A7S4A7G6_9STRA|mmetsp:Transcript_16822/g.52511  ORF Transcript_16822/g.52511 Transcript_16822/m.52511 type:complete len:575 (+) Transcript_16822:1192-2916(+)